nr:DUF5753 domain-containing protein [Planomonospora venezuelensis]
MSRESEERAWWEDYADVLSDSYSTYIGLEAGAASMLTCQTLVFPGLLQIPDYAQATMGTAKSVNAPSPGEAARRVQVRMRRQRLLDGPDPLHFTALIDESVLHRRFSTAEVMQRQLRHVMEVAARPHVVIRIQPLGIDHSLMLPSFVLLKFSERERLGRLHDDIVYLENAMDATFEEDEVTTYSFDRAFRHMASEAFSKEQSLRLITDALRRTT